MLLSKYEVVSKLELIKKIQSNKSRNIKVYDVLDNRMLSELNKDLNNSLKRKGLSIVVSGVFQLYDRDEIKEVIKKNGGKISSSISSKTDYLVAGDKMGPAKRTKAEDLKIKIITELELNELIS